jgi:MFS family permease
MLEVAKIPHVWLVACWGALVFGAMIASGVVWAPKLVAVRGMPEAANVAASVMWLGLAVGCLVVPRWSDAIRRRKLPTVAGIAIQLGAMTALLYLPAIGIPATFFLCFMFGAGAAAHMLAFSSAGDVVAPRVIGTSAAIVNGVMFLASGILIAVPGHIAAKELAGGSTASMTLAEHAANPVLAGLVVALVLAAVMKETFPDRVPRQRAISPGRSDPHRDPHPGISSGLRSVP